MISHLSMRRGYTLIELIVAVGLFAIIMTLATGAYLVTIATNREAQATATGVNNIAFAIEDMARTIRTGTGYSCNGGGDCPYPSGASSLSFNDSSGNAVTYSLSNGAILKNGAAITDSTITINSLDFYVSGTDVTSNGDYLAPQVIIVISGSVVSGPGTSKDFTIETSATMRGVDI